MLLTKQERIEEHIDIESGYVKMRREKLQVGTVRETGRAQTAKTLMKSGLYDVGQKFYASNRGPLNPQPQACLNVCLHVFWGRGAAVFCCQEWGISENPL